MSDYEQRLAAYEAQVRSDFTTEEMEKMGKAGEAFDNGDGSYSYPTPTIAYLKKAIKAVGRGNADHDKIRKYVIGRGKALDSSDLIPDNWNSDGSLADEEKAANWTAQHRADDMTYGDMMDMLNSAVAEKFCTGDDDWCWVQDFTDAWVVFSKNGEKMQSDYTMDGETVVLAEAVPVREQTTYVPMETKSAPTKADPKVMAALIAAKAAIVEAAAAQAKDPDKDSDPDDVKVNTQLGVIGHALDMALAAQALDGNDDAEKKSVAHTVPAVPKRSFSSLTERPMPNVTQFRFATTTEGSTGVPFTGYASTTGDSYNVRDWLGEYAETIGQGSFVKTLREQSSIPLLQNHDPNYVLANTESGTSVLAEDAIGLRNDADINPEFSQLITGMRRNDVNKMSFSFRTIKDTWNDDYDARTVQELALYDTSIVTYPANPATSAQLLDEFRSALGRDGVAVGYSVRSALLDVCGGRIAEAAEPLFEQAIRALALTDESLQRRSTSYALQGRARTFLVAGVMEQLRVGKPVSAANMKLVTSAMDAISAASAAHEQITTAHAAATEALTTLSAAVAPAEQSSEEADEGAAAPANGLDGDGNGPGGATGAENDQNADGLGVRKVPQSVIRAQRQLDLLKIKR